MKYALVNGNKSEATKGTKGLCPACDSEVIAKCGEIKIHHWAHKGNRNCDSWWENETEWHRDWKNQFSEEWQEIVHHADDGEKHIADVKTEEGWALEFQHSYLKPEERRSRNDFYKQLIWVVDGNRRKRDRIQFRNILDESIKFCSSPGIYNIGFSDECRLLNEWGNCSGPVFFDFQEKNSSGNLMLWCLIGNSLLMPCTKMGLIEKLQSKSFSEFLQDILLKVNNIQRKNHMKARLEESRRLGELYLPKKRRPNYRL